MGQEISQQQQRQYDCTSISINSEHNSHKTKQSSTPIAKYSSYEKIPKTSSSSNTPIIPLTYEKILEKTKKFPSSRTSSTTDINSAYYSACYCSSSCSLTSSKSQKSIDKQKDYLSHHLYIKSYLDILEEDEKAKEHFKAARPGIRNYTPKILAEKKARKLKEELWI